MAKSCNIFQYENQYINLFLNFPRSPIFHSSVFSTLPIFHILYYPSSSFSALSIFHTPRFPYSLFPHSYFPRFHFPHFTFFSHSSFSTLSNFKFVFSQLCLVSRLGEPNCLCEEKLSPLPGLTYLPRWDNSSTRVVSPLETTLGHSYKRLFKF